MRLLKVGRDKSCDIVLPSGRVSSLHAEITVLDNGDILLEDKNSLNGTYVMNNPIKPGVCVSIKRGDAVRFADTELQWNQVPQPLDTKNYKAVYGIGKDIRNEIQLPGSTVSRFHATLLVGKDGKAYLEDHSKNGTTVNGTRISNGQKVRVKRGDAVACGGVPVDVSRFIPKSVWPKILTALAAAAAIILVVLAVRHFAVGTEKTDKWVNERYKNATCLVVGGYHYEVSIPNLDLNKLNDAFSKSKLQTIPTRIVQDKDGKFMGTVDDSNLYSGTGFFVSKDGNIVTNLHVAKPWLADLNSEGNPIADALRQWIGSILTTNANILLINGYNLPIAAYINDMKVEGKLDYIGVVPNGYFYDANNLEKCRVIYSEGDNLNVDVAMLTTVNGRLPQGCTYVNVEDSIRVTDEDCRVGTHICTIGFPAGTGIQNIEESKISALFHAGSITQIRDSYSFGFDAATFHGASGSPIFDNNGYLIGVVNLGGTAQLNYGIKSRYVKEMIEKIK